MSSEDQLMLMRALETHFGLPRAIPAPRAALGLLALLQCWRGERAHCKVALPAALCHEVVVAVRAAGCEPVFCDVDPRDGLVPDQEWRSARAQGAEVAVVVHLYGNVASLSVVREIFPSGSCLVVDDAAQALGSHSEAGAAGALGDVGLLSFGPTKQIDVGDAALLFRDQALAEAVEARMLQYQPVPAETRAALVADFRARLETARQRLRETGEASSFSGLLDGLAPVLMKQHTPGAARRVLDALAGYDVAMLLRREKAELWHNGMASLGLIPVGMGNGVIPWRYACRLPGIGWMRQHLLAEAMRVERVQVSNWYLPAHWFLGQPTGSLNGTETLAREVFQFWVDPSTSIEEIQIGVSKIKGVLDNSAVP